MKEDFDYCRAPSIAPWNGVWQKVQDRGKPGKAPSRARFTAQKHVVERQLRTMPRKRPRTMAADSVNSPPRGRSGNDKAFENSAAVVEEKGLTVSNCLEHWMRKALSYGEGVRRRAMIDLVNRYCTISSCRCLRWTIIEGGLSDKAFRALTRFYYCRQ